MELPKNVTVISGKRKFSGKTKKNVLPGDIIEQIENTEKMHDDKDSKASIGKRPLKFSAVIANAKENLGNSDKKEESANQEPSKDQPKQPQNNFGQQSRKDL